jgi:hypothetical protein
MEIVGDLDFLMFHDLLEGFVNVSAFQYNAKLLVVLSLGTNIFRYYLRVSILARSQASLYICSLIA